MKELFMPKNEGVKMSYYEAYYASVARSAANTGIDVRFVKDERVWCGKSVNAYMACLDGKSFVMDFSDFEKMQVRTDKFNVPIFKWQYNWLNPIHASNPMVHPLCPLQDFDWTTFKKIRGEVEYKADGDLITNNQRIRAGAKDRRAMVQRVLVRKCGEESVSTKFIDQKQWWLLHDKCLVAVHVPGARNNMLDRGQLELMGLGVCVISPVIYTTLAGPTTLKSDVHYLQVKDDYSNLIETIEWCREHRAECVAIGRNAKELYDRVVWPVNYWKYIESVLNGSH